MSIKTAVIVPAVVAHNLDPHTGIPFMPHMAAHMAGALDYAGYDVQVIDCFGLDPHHRQIIDEFMIMGVDEKWVVDQLDPNVKIVYLYCRTVEDFISSERLVEAIHAQRPTLKICLFENIQTVNSFSLRHIVMDLFAKGACAAILGEPERRAHVITEALLANRDLNQIPGIAFLNAKGELVVTPDEPFDKHLDELAFPLWEKFPLEGYWQAGFAHAPVGKYRFLPLLTSRGCPYRCTFCISPGLNPKWRGRGAKSVVDEMEYFYRRMNVVDFHVSDLDPTVDDKRTRAICEELIRRQLPITWKLAQGTKIETIKNEETLELMAKAGCRFISFSPETGSTKLLKIMNKPFDHAHGLRMARKMHQLGIRIQSCFIAGVPGEDEEDRRLSIEYVKQLIRAGVDEIAVTIFTPLPGAALSEAIKGYTHYSQLTHSPTWRADYKEIQWYRYRMYGTFFLFKLLHPLKVIREISGLVSGRFETKMEMSLFKVMKLRLLYFFPGMFKKLAPKEAMQQLNSIKREKGAMALYEHA